MLSQEINSKASYSFFPFRLPIPPTRLCLTHLKSKCGIYLNSWSMTPTEEAVLFVWVPAQPLNCTLCLRLGRNGKVYLKGWETVTFCGDGEGFNKEQCDELMFGQKDWYKERNRLKQVMWERQWLVWMSRRLKRPLPPQGSRRFILPAGSVWGSIWSEGLWRETDRERESPLPAQISFCFIRQLLGLFWVTGEDFSSSQSSPNCFKWSNLV